MAEYKSIIGIDYVGREKVQQYITDVERMSAANRAASAAQITGMSGSPGQSAFAESDITAETIGAQARAYDEVLRRATAVAKAERERMAVMERLTDPSKSYSQADQKDLWEGANAKVDAARQALANALGKEAKARERGAALIEADHAKANRTRLLGASSAIEGSPIGPLQYSRSVLTRAAAEGTRRAEAERRAEEKAVDQWWRSALATREKRTKISEADAQAAEQRARTDAAIDAYRPTYANPDPATALGKAQTGVNRTQRALEIAEQEHAKLLASNNNDLAARHRSEQAVINAENAYVAAQRKVTAALASQAGGSGGLGAIRGQFMTGFRGASERPYAEQIGQAFKFSVFYGTAYKLLFALTQTFQQTLQEGIEFQNAMTELKIASGASVDAANEMAAGLGQQATQAGLAPSQGVLLGARSLGLFGATEASGASVAEQTRIAEISARVVSRMALGSKTDPQELQTQIAAVANAFGGGAAGQLRAYDLDAYLGRQFGIMQGATIQAVAEAGTVGQAAGFNQEQVSAIAAYLQSRTGQTPSAVAGWMAQIFSRGGEGSLTALTSRYGIDQSADLSTQIQELAKVYKTASATERADLAAGFGRGKVQNAAVVLLEGLDKVMSTADRARSEAGGEGDRIFEERIGNIGGQIQQTVAVMKDFASALSQSGALQVLGAGIIAFRELVEGVTVLIRAWNEVPGVMRGAIAAVALWSVATRNAAIMNPLVSRAGMVGTGVATAAGVYGPPTAAAAGMSGAAGVAAAGKAALATVGPFALAAGGLMAIASLKSSADNMRRAQESATDALQNSGLTTSSTGSDYLASASELDLLAKQNREATGWFANAITFGQANNSNEAMAEELEREAARRRRIAERIDERTSNISVDAPAITGFDETSLKESLDLITATGGTAAERMDALSNALRGTADAAVRAASEIDPAEFSGRLATTIKDGIDEIPRKISVLGTKVPMQRSYEVYTGRSTDEFSTAQYETRNISEVFNATQSDLQRRLRQQLKERGVSDLTQLDPKMARDIAGSIVQDSDFDTGLSDEDLADARQGIVDMVFRQLRGEAKSWRALLKRNTDLTREEVVTVVNAINEEYDAIVDDLPENDLGGRLKAQRGRLRELMTARNDTSNKDLPILMRAIGNARANIARTEIERLDQVRRAAQQSATSAAAIRKAGMTAIRGRVAAALASGDVDVLAEVISNSGKVGVNIARKAIAQSIAAAKAAIRMQSAMSAIQAWAGNAFAGLTGLVANADDLQSLAEMQEFQSALAGMTYGSAEETLKGTDVEGTDKYFPDKKSAEDRKAEREAARQEMLDLKNNLYLLSIDLSDPLAMATAAVKDARRRLQSDIASGQKPGQIAADRVALRQAQIEREATAFQQRLSAVQTAEELGRISHQKYINYLQSEHRRLEGIKNRTYQQQQQLDEIDKLMKDAAESMQGQWNFGDIKLPTPYQVRRQVEQMRLDRATQLDGVSRAAASNSTIYIDGADTGKVRQIISEVLDKSNATVTNRPRKR